MESARVRRRIIRGAEWGKGMKPFIAASGTLFLLLFMLGCTLENNKYTPLSLPDSEQLQRDLATLDWVFTPVDPKNTTESFASAQKSIDSLKRRFPEISQASNVSAHLGYLSKPVLKQSAEVGSKVDQTFTNPRLVWIITLSDIVRQSSGPPGAPRKQSNELNILVDAKTSDYLMEFIWTR